MSPQTEIARRRRTLLKAGLATIVLVSLTVGATACIFDQGDYKGGGRIGRAATAQQEKVGTGSSSSSGGRTNGDDDDTTIILDAGGVGFAPSH